MYFLDCTGKTCPVPVIETKKAVDEERPDEIRVAVDSDVSRENVKRFLESRGYRVTVGTEGAAIVVSGVMERREAAAAAAEKRIVALIDTETLGRGDDTLGAILMKSFVLTLKEISPLPWRVIFINGGVRLASEGSALLPYLKELEDLGVELLSCGTCLDFFGLKEKLGSGRVSNMFEIVSSLTEATNVLKP